MDLQSTKGMAAFFIEKIFKKRGEAPSTEKALVGRLYEACAEVYCQRIGFQIIKKNIRFKIGEIDCLAHHKKNDRLMVIEVRGRKAFHYRPSQTLSYRKKKRLKIMSEIIARQYQKPTDLILLEIIGEIPKGVSQKELSNSPEKFGLQLFVYRLIP